MKLSELIRKPVSLIVENDILKDVVEDKDTALKILEKITGRNPEDILVVYIDNNKKIKGVITSLNVSNKLDEILQREQDPAEIIVSSLKWEKMEDIWIIKSEPIEQALVKFGKGASDMLIVTSDEGVYSGKIKRKNAVQKLRELSD